MEFSRADFDNPAVAQAKQVSSYGYHYGMSIYTLRSIDCHLIHSQGLFPILIMDGCQRVRKAPVSMV
jgi:hypothetical protein